MQRWQANTARGIAARVALHLINGFASAIRKRQSNENEYACWMARIDGDAMAGVAAHCNRKLHPAGASSGAPRRGRAGTIMPPRRPRPARATKIGRAHV